MSHHIQFISSWLTDGTCHSADILTVAGMGGIGKTSLAKYVFQLHCAKFHKSSFIEGINERCNEHFNGLLDLQKQLHRDISRKTPLQVNDVSVYTSKIENTLAHKMVFIVLDDINSLDELDALLGNKGLHPGSKIIITSKNASLIERYTLFDPQIQPKHTKVLLNGLCEAESLELLCTHAFKSQYPKEGYREVLEKLVKYCDGHPLALKVLAKSIRNCEDVNEWEYYVEALKNEPHSRIKKTLEMSINSLPSNKDKNLFKHIACFFVGMDKDLTETILNSCYKKTRSGIKNLIDSCLLSIKDNKLMMHQLIQEMGRDLVRQESLDKPRKRSRLCCHEESFKVLKQKKSKRNLLGLSLDMRMLEKKKPRGSFELKKDSLRKMNNLMLLQLNHVRLNGRLRIFPKELRWLCMHGFPLKSLDIDLPMKNLVSLDMSYNNIKTFDMSYSISQPQAKRQKLRVGSYSKGKRLLGSLKVLDLSFCEQLRSLGGFFELPALEKLIAVNCIRLIEVCESVDQCVELFHINLSYCYSLIKLPSLAKLKKVQTLLLDGCNLSESPIETWDTKSSDISINSQTSSSTIIDTIPNDLTFLEMSLPCSLIVLSLANNSLSDESFPMDFSCLSKLEELCLDDNPIVSMPNCVRSLPRLKILSMENCEMIKSIKHPPHMLRVLKVGFRNTSLRNINFDPRMCPLNIDGPWKLLSPSSYEIDGMIKIQPMAWVEINVLHSLGWKNIEFTKERHLETCTFGGSDKSQTKMYYEFGIFSTMYYEEKGMPNWIRNISKCSTISFVVPSSPKKLRGINFCCVETMRQFTYDTFVLPKIKVSNATKNQTWIYNHYIDKVKVGGKYLTMLSHWMFGSNEMTPGDQITINVTQRYYNEQFTKTCGVNIVYDEDIEEEEDVLGYYKSWNHIIGGDLSAFGTSTTTREYLLSSMHFFDDSRYKEKEVSFKAFS